MPPLISPSLAKSPLWQTQLDYYKRLGIHAWNNRVPYFITNTWRFAHEQARFISHYLDDAETEGHTQVTICEFGCGIGQLSVRLLKLLEAQCLQKKTLLKIRYLLIDASNQVLNYLKTHPELQQCTQITLEFHLLGILPNTPIDLDSLKLSPNPTIVLAHYFFDSLYQEAFYKTQDAYHLAHTQVSTRPTFTGQHHKEHLHFQPNLNERAQYPPESVLAHVLQAHHTLNISHFLIPEGAIKLIEAITHTCKHVFLLVSDKGYHDPHSAWFGPDFDFIPDGALSSCVNFFALDQAIQCIDHATSWISPATHPQDPINFIQGAWLIGSDPGPYTQTHTQCRENITRTSHLDAYLSMKACAKENCPQILIGMLRAWYFEPSLVLETLSPHLHSGQTLDVRLLGALKACLNQITYSPTPPTLALCKALQRLSHTLELQGPEVHAFRHKLNIWYGIAMKTTSLTS